MCMHLYMYVYVSIIMYVNVLVSKYVCCMLVFMEVYVCMYVWYMCICVYNISTYVCMYICMYTHSTFFTNRPYTYKYMYFVKFLCIGL